MPDYTREEQGLAKADGARLVHNSGRGSSKGDATLGSMNIDYKFTDGKSFSLNDSGFQKHYMEVYKEGYQGVIVVYFNQTDRKRAIVDWEWLKMLEENYREHNGISDDIN